MFVLVLACAPIFAGCSTPSKSGGASELSADQSICEQIQSTYNYYPTVPAGGIPDLSRQSAMDLEATLKHAPNALRGEAAPLERAIENRSDSEIENILSKVIAVCDSFGITPAT